MILLKMGMCEVVMIRMKNMAQLLVNVNVVIVVILIVVVRVLTNETIHYQLLKFFCSLSIFAFNVEN